MSEEKIREKRVGVLWDIQNTVITALRDLEAVQEHLPTILLAAASCIEEEVERLGACVIRIGAFSVPLDQPEKYDQRFWRWIKGTADLWRIGYTLFLSPEEKNAADYDITQNSLDLLQSKNVTACVLVTGDGSKPFPNFVSRVAGAGIETHILSYDRVPHSFKNNLVVRTTVIASAIKEFLIAMRADKDEECKRPRRRKDRLSPPAPRIFLAKDRHTIIDAVRYSAGAKVEYTADIKQWQPFIWRSVSAILRAAQSAEQTTPFEPRFKTLKQILIEELKEEKGIGHKEIELLINALIECTDRFEKINVYPLNPHSRMVPETEEKPPS